MSKICPFCSASIKDIRHLNYCEWSSKEFSQLSKSEKKIESLRLVYPELTKENLYELYIKKGYSLPLIKKEYGIDYKSTLFLLDYFQITKRTIQNCRTELSNRRHRETSIKNYGVPNVSQSKDIQEKKRQTFLSHYGVDNIFKQEAFKSKLNAIIMSKYGVNRVTNPQKYEENFLKKYGCSWPSQLKSVRDKIEKTNLQRYGNICHLANPDIIAKTRKTCKEKYGFEYSSQSPEVREKISKSSKDGWARLTDDQKQYRLEKIYGSLKNKNFRSKLEFRIENILMQWKIDHDIIFKPIYFIGNLSYDFLINNCVLLEIQGDYWHANPFVYKAEDAMRYPGKIVLAKDVWAKDELKKQKAIDKGFEIAYIWENEMKKLTDEELEILVIQRIYQDANNGNKEHKEN